VGDKLAAAAWSGYDLHATESLSLPSPFCFWLCMPACSQCRLNIEVLFSSRIDVFFSPLSLKHTDMPAHTQHRGSIDARCWWRFIIEKEIVSIWVEFVTRSFVLVIYIAGHLWQSALWDPFLLAVFVCVWRRETSSLSVVFVSVSVLITIWLIYLFSDNTKVRYTVRLSLVWEVLSALLHDLWKHNQGWTFVLLCHRLFIFLDHFTFKMSLSEHSYNYEKTAFLISLYCVCTHIWPQLGY